MNQAMFQWRELVEHVNGRGLMAAIGVRDPEYPCESFDAQGYNGRGECESDGHYLCTECSELSPLAPRFTEHGAPGRLDRIRLLRRSICRSADQSSR